MILQFFVLFLNVLSIKADQYEDGPWRKSLDGEGACWTDRSCTRVMTCAHGGEWNATIPYDSMPAFMKAYEDGADAVKGDFRVSKDNIGVVMHSSPVEFYESLNCRGKYVEQMTADECSQCQMALTNIKFTTVPDMLRWADGKVNVMYCVKETADIPRAISTLIENSATHRAFLEISVSEVINLEATAVEGWNQVYYVINLGGSDDLHRMLSASTTLQSRCILLEFNGWEENWVNVEEDVALAESSGFRTFAATKDSQVTATVENHMKLFGTGFDVAYTYNLQNAVEARKIVNSQNGIAPP